MNAVPYLLMLADMIDFSVYAAGLIDGKPWAWASLILGLWLLMRLEQGT